MDSGLLYRGYTELLRIQVLFWLGSAKIITYEL